MALATTGTVALDGLAIACDLEVPGAARANTAADWTLTFPGCDVPVAGPATVWHGDVSEGGDVWGRFGWRGNRVHVHLAAVGDLLASPRSRTATIHVAPGCAGPVAALRRLAPYLASLDGRIVLHAACAALPAGALLFLAEAGTGKSTLALALDVAGVPVLGDDHVALTETPAGHLVHPSFAFVDVGQAARIRFRPDLEAGPGKRSVMLRTPRPHAPIALAALVFLKRARELSVSRMRTAATVVRLMKESLFAVDLLDERRLDAILALAASRPAYALSVPDDLRRLPEVVAHLRGGKLGGGR